MRDNIRDSGYPELKGACFIGVDVNNLRPLDVVVSIRFRSALEDQPQTYHHLESRVISETRPQGRSLVTNPVKRF